jgi:nucleoside-diphosphate-sugar epimerase
VNKKIVLTGASGFIGNALYKRLKNTKGLSVIPVSRNLGLKNYFYSKDYCELPSGDILVHLGEESNRIKVNNSGEEYCKKCTKVIESIINKGYRHIIYASSSSIYGESGVSPYSEKMEIYQTDEYSKIKITNENLVLESGGGVARISNVIGLEMSSTNVLSNIISQLSKSGPILVQDTTPIRDFIFLDNVVEALLLMIQNQAAGIFNIGSGSATSIQRLAELCLITDGQIDRRIESKLNSSAYSFNVVDPTKITNTLKWKPSVSLQDSIMFLLNKK